MSKQRYTYPAHVDEEQLRQRAAKRRAALVAHGCSTYTIGYRGETRAIACLCCGLGSAVPGDIKEKYCGFCHAYHSEWQEPEAQP